MADRLFYEPCTRRVAAVRVAAQLAGAAFVAEQRAMTALFWTTPDTEREFVAEELGCVLHLSPVSAGRRLAAALAFMDLPALVTAVESGRVGVSTALALVEEVSGLSAWRAGRVLVRVLAEPDDAFGRLALTPGQARLTAKRAVLLDDPSATRRRHEAAKRTAGVSGRPGRDGMGRLVIDCTATDLATALVAVRGRAGVMRFAPVADGEGGLREPTQGEKDVAACLHALGCDRVSVQAVLECPVERAVDLVATAGAPVWTVDVRMPVAVALGLSDHPGVLAGYGPLSADQARALLPQADLVRACVDSETGEVLAVDPPVRARTWQAADEDRSRALRQRLLAMATASSSLPVLTCDGYVPSQALGRLVDLRDVTSTFPGDLRPARRTDRDHRLPYPLGPTSAENLQNLSRHPHRAKTLGVWRSEVQPDGTIRWTTRTGNTYLRRPVRTAPPPIAVGQTLPPLIQADGSDSKP